METRAAEKPREIGAQIESQEPLPRGKRKTWPAFYVLAYFVVVGFGLFLFDGQLGNLIFFGLIGLFCCIGFVIHNKAHKRRKHLGHKFSLAMIGLALFLGAGVFGRQSFQIEGFFFYLLHGVAGGVVIHYLVAKIVGPLFIGRSYCGWGCWTWMVFDYLPFKKTSHQPVGRWSKLRHLHLGISLALVAGLWFGMGYRHGTDWKTTDGLEWFLVGNGLYYTLGVGLAYWRKDNRAFCKILCPISVFLKVGARHSVLKVTGNKEGCTQCGACDKACPMDIGISQFVQHGRRVLSSDCTLCQQCLVACRQNNLDLTLGLD